MRHFDAPWAIAGGWAIDLYLDRHTRPHADVDIAILREDQRQLWTGLRPRGAEYVDSGVLRRWNPDAWLALPTHEVYVTTADGSRLEILLNEHDPARREWVYRRDPLVRRALDRTFRRTRDVPYLAPEVVLLYKSKSPRPCDEADFAATMPVLETEAREWLRTALDSTTPRHAWASAIARSG
jgi:hypothetical protein